MTDNYNAQWHTITQGNLDPVLLANGQQVKQPHGYHPIHTPNFTEHHEHRMFFEMQKLAKEHVALLERLEENLAQLNTLHAEVNNTYQTYLTAQRAHSQACGRRLH